MKFKYIKESVDNDDIVYAIKFTSDMTGDSFYVCGKDEEVLDSNTSDIRKAFFDVVYSEDDYWWHIAYGKYENLLEDLKLFEMNDMDEPVDESNMEIIDSYHSRF